MYPLRGRIGKSGRSRPECMGPSSTGERWVRDDLDAGWVKDARLLPTRLHTRHDPCRVVCAAALPHAVAILWPRNAECAAHVHAKDEDPVSVHPRLVDIVAAVYARAEHAARGWPESCLCNGPRILG